MEELHEGANILLAHWHYYRTDEDPLEVDIMDQHRSRLADLKPEQFSLVKRSCVVMREKSKLSLASFHVNHAWGDIDNTPRG